MSDIYMKIPLEDIEVQAADNPRKKAEDSRYTLKSLMENIEENHLINPITVEQKDDGKYTLVAGYRRLQAFKDLHAEGKRKSDYNNRYATIPALAKHAMKDKLFVALSENLARKDLTEEEKAKSVYAFRNQTNETIRGLADKLGISKTYADKLYQRGKQLASPTDANKTVALSVLFYNPGPVGELIEKTEKTVGLMKGMTKLSTEEKVELMRTSKALLDDLSKLISFIKSNKKKLAADAAVKTFFEEQKQAKKAEKLTAKWQKPFKFTK